jgi:hypothetical protein
MRSANHIGGERGKHGRTFSNRPSFAAQCIKLDPHIVEDFVRSL